MDLPDDDVETFQLAITYLYRGNFGAPASDPGINLDHEEPVRSVYALIRLAEIGERWLVDDLKATVHDELNGVLRNRVKFHKDVLEVQDLELAFKKLPYSSKTLSLIVDYAADDFLRDQHEEIEQWRLGKAVETIEGLETMLLLRVKKLAFQKIHKVRQSLISTHECPCEIDGCWGHEHCCFCPRGTWLGHDDLPFIMGDGDCTTPRFHLFI